MLVITLQFSYTQETIYNALNEDSNAKKKESHCSTVKVLTALSRSIHYTALQTEQREACHANVALLSSVHVFLWPVCPSPCFPATVLSRRKEKKNRRRRRWKKKKKNMPVHWWSLLVYICEKILCCFLYTWRCLTLSCNRIKYCYWQNVVSSKIINLIPRHWQSEILC